MTREEVSQIYYLTQEIRQLQSRLTPMKRDEILTPQKMDGMPRAAGRTSDPTGSCAVSNADLKLQIEKLLHEVKKKQREIFEYIGSVEDSMIRMIIVFRCVDLCTWEEVARKIGGPMTAEAARKAFARHFEAEESRKI